MSIGWKKSASLAVLALAGFTGPALANGPGQPNNSGWYLGAGVGFDHLNSIKVVTPSGAWSNLGQQDSVFVSGSFGYRWSSNLRMEFEAGYDRHNAKTDATFVSGVITGSNDLKSALVNVIYDWNLGSQWSVSLGGGAGMTELTLNMKTSTSPALSLLRGQHTEFMWQGIVGLNYDLDPTTEIFADYRYRSAEVNRGYGSDFAAFNPMHINEAQENVAMLGIRWFVGTPSGH